MLLNQTVDKISLLAECDKCVMCGLCLPHCPTYTLTLDENESPRGRIALARALLQEQITYSTMAQQHLDHCLLCRACERLCPSGVQYGRIIDGVRAQQQTSTASLPFPVADKQALQKLNHRLWWYQKSGLQHLSGILRLLGKGELARKAGLLPVISRQQPWAERYPANTEKKGEVQLFTGCLNNSLDHQSLRDAVRVLNQLGYEVIVPAKQNCCGAVDLHKGNARAADSLALTNATAFDAVAAPVISLNSGCSATLQEYLPTDVMDVCDFLLREAVAPAFRPLAKRVAVHSPCSQKNVLRTEANVSRVLTGIPSLEVINLPPSLSCCGAAGGYMLDFPEQARAIRDPVIEAIRESRADLLVTSNLGCGMFLQAGLREQGIDITVMHPARLLAEQLS